MRDKRIIVAGWYAVDPTKRATLVAGCTDLVVRARSAPGCLDFAITADAVDPSRVNIFECWRSDGDLRAWRRVARHSKARVRIRRVEVQKHVVDSSGPPV
jgi:quinol monooxygenase YgiN